MSHSNPSVFCSKAEKRPFHTILSLSLVLFHPLWGTSHPRGEGEQRAPLPRTRNQQRFFCRLDGNAFNFPQPISHLLTEICSQSHTPMQIKSKAPWAWPPSPIFSISGEMLWTISLCVLLIGKYRMWRDRSVLLFQKKRKKKLPEVESPESPWCWGLRGLRGLPLGTPVEGEDDLVTLSWPGVWKASVNGCLFLYVIPPGGLGFDLEVLC